MTAADTPGGAPAPIVTGAVNLRDVGGLPAGDRRARHGVLYRSGNLAQLEPRGIEDLAALQLRRIIDLRSDEEVLHAPSPAAAASEIVRVPLFLGSVASFFENDISLDEMYRRLVDDSADRVVQVVRGIVSDQPVLVHCTVGKDRTGVVVALTLAAAGVDEDAVISDYARTEGLLPAWRNRGVIERLRALHPRARHLEELATRSPAPVMRRLLDDLTGRFGSVSDYLRASGLSDDEIGELRRVLID
ncbi:tyrosine-protein phosphatase [Microbacterium immunditiarum]|uniref:Protein-tyrosine phosphatase n=1 Tax=Microbacterium immunditiarum TaxID=337480 RepID=A0A7Y9KM54_9MICO|nr:protein-tyrosine phosphatase [Microbacterium immunditiarum]